MSFTMFTPQELDELEKLAKALAESEEELKKPICPVIGQNFKPIEPVNINCTCGTTSTYGETDLKLHSDYCDLKTIKKIDVDLSNSSDQIIALPKGSDFILGQRLDFADAFTYSLWPKP